MKLNNKGFAISTVLYGLLALLILIVMLIFQIMRTGSNNSKELGETVQQELDNCKEERLEYNSCIDATNDGNDDCKDLKNDYQNCIG